MSKLLKDIKSIVKFEHAGEVLNHNNPMKFLFENGLAIQIGNGLFVLKGILVDILKIIESLICKIAKEVGAEPVFVPSILSWDNLQKTQYLNSFKNQAIMMTTYENVKQVQSSQDPVFLGIACPTVCYHYFSSLNNKSVDHNYAITAITRCTRGEEGDLNDLSRLTNFTMREVVFYGTNEYCSEKLQETLNKTIEMLNSVFDLTYEVITAHDPFFGVNAEIKEKAQLLSESKYEVQTLLPYNNNTISIGSFNNHGSVFYERFNIKSSKPELNFSACVGWGYERMLYTILSQKGVDFSSTYYKKLLNTKI